MSDALVTSRLAAIRRQQGFSVAALASAIGVTRQTIYAIENGSFVPNTAVSLRLAALLKSSVEDLFRLETPEPETIGIAFLPGDAEVLPGQPVKLCQVGGRTVALALPQSPSFLPSSDAVLVRTSGARLVNPESLGDNRLLVAGCDPALSILARHARKAGLELILAHRNSSEALQLLKDGLIHVAGTHLHEKTNPIPRSLAVVSFASWEQGIVYKSHSFNSLPSIAKRGVRFVNREVGSGTRALLDQNLQALGMDSRQIRGYETIAPGHLAAAWQVKTGAADCCIATRSAATHFGLRFTPLISERYDFVVHRRSLKAPQVQKLFNILGEPRFRREVATLGGYEVS